jgi:hypothetical protein
MPPIVIHFPTINNTKLAGNKSHATFLQTRREIDARACVGGHRCPLVLRQELFVSLFTMLKIIITN